MYELSDECNEQLEAYWDHFPHDASAGVEVLNKDETIDLQALDPRSHDAPPPARGRPPRDEAASPTDLTPSRPHRMSSRRFSRADTTTGADR